MDQFIQVTFPFTQRKFVATAYVFLGLVKVAGLANLFREFKVAHKMEKISTKNSWRTAGFEPQSLEENIAK